jgi:hypothetical protein
MLNESVREFLDFLIPPVNDESICGSSVWRVSEDRVEIAESLLSFLDREVFDQGLSFTEAHALLQKIDKGLYLRLTNAVLEDFFASKSVKSMFFQNSPAPFPKGYTLPPTDWSILEPVTNLPLKTRIPVSEV